MNPYLNQYQNNHILTASPEQILIMLYDGAIRFAGQAQQCMQKNDMAGKGKYIGKTIAILSEFSNTLNHEVDSQLAENLDALYTYMIAQLGKANVENDPAPIDHVKSMLTDLRQTWNRAIETNNNSHSALPQAEERITAIGATI